MLDPKLRQQFPKDFLWGASVATHQVEGGNTNQWSRWEHENAARLAKTATEKLGWIPCWNDVKDEANNPLNYVSGKGVDHFNQYKLDFKLARSLNLNAMRSGIEWSRIAPKKGTYDPAAIDHYNDYFLEMKQQGLEPFVNLFHWTMPEWVADAGGFASGGNMKHWRDYVHCLAQNIDFANINYVLTINEANSYSSLSYGSGEWPPNEKNFITSAIVYYRLAKAHRIAYKILKKKWPHLQIGVAHQCNKAIGSDKPGKLAAKLQLWYWNWSWLKKARWHDFIGFNYYFTDHRKGISLIPNANPKEPLNDLGWYMEPSGIEDVIMAISKRYKNKPIFVTENGVADMHDQYREWWLQETLKAMANSIKKGANLQGYLHWSLLDNFEWAYGWFPKFGLISVDRKTMKRTVKKSAKTWARWLRLDSKV